MSNSNQTKANEPKFTVRFRLQRDITEYEPSAHFLERLKYRTDPEPTKAIAQEVVEEGAVKTTQESDRVIFEKEDVLAGSLKAGSYTWRVLVAVNEDAFYQPESYHTLLTIYAKGAHDADHKDVFEVN